MIRYALPLLAIIALTQPSAAQTSYEPEDAERLEACLGAAGTGGGTEEERACIGVASQACIDASEENQTTIGMVECTLREHLWWDERLNGAYAELERSLDEGEFTELRKAQRAWLAYREADCGFQYDYWREGTIRTIFAASCQLQTTAERALALEEYVAWTEGM